MPRVCALLAVRRLGYTLARARAGRSPLFPRVRAQKVDGSSREAYPGTRIWNTSVGSLFFHISNTRFQTSFFSFGNSHFEPFCYF